MVVLGGFILAFVVSVWLVLACRIPQGEFWRAVLQQFSVGQLPDWGHLALSNLQWL